MTWVRSAVLALGMIGVMAVGTAQAQINEPIKFSTAFPFRVGEVTLPAGSYTIRPLENVLDVMEISNGRDAAFFDAEDVSVRNGAKIQNQVVFTKTGNTYTLSKIVDASERTEVETPWAALTDLRRGHHAHD